MPKMFRAEVVGVYELEISIAWEWLKAL